MAVKKILESGFTMLSPELSWRHASSDPVTSEELVSILRGYVSQGLTIYVGSDSMLYGNFCIFSCIVAVHCNSLNIARYFYQKEKIVEKRYKNLDVKILKEVELSINAANFIKSQIPDANIEVHVDIGDQERNATRHLVDNARGWVVGMGYHLRIKPDSWASSVADWHTK